MSNSYTPPDRSTYDPGWNDPPPMPVAGADGSVTKPARTKLNLNKRIAFPMAGVGANASTSSNVKTTAEGLPLPFSTAKYQTPPSVFQPAPTAAEIPPSTVPLPPPAAILLPNNSISSNPVESSPVASAIQSTTEDPFDSTAARVFCQSIFGRLSDAMASKLEIGKITEIRKRLDILDGMWLEDKLDRSTQIDLFNIAKALDDNNVESAKEQHRELVVNHINACNQWGTALRQIILSLDETHSGPSNHDGPAVLPENEVSVVQFLNVGSMAHVIEGSAPFAINSIEPIATLETNASENVPLPTNDNANNNEDRVLSQSFDEPSSSKSKNGRFGRILHI